MDWENPPFTFAIFGSLVRHFSLMRTVLFVYFTLYLDAEYALCAPLFILVPTFSVSSLIHVGRTPN